MNEINPLPIENNLSSIILNNQVEKHQSSLKNIGKDASKAKEAAEEFESFLLYYVLKSMRKAIPKSDLLHSSAEDMFTSMLDQEIAKKSVQKGEGLGLAPIILQQLTKPDSQTLEGRHLPVSKTKNNYQAAFANYR